MVDRSAGPDGCWPWTGGRSRGYGQVLFAGEKLRCHRVAWELANGRPFPDHLVAMHSCDNKPCVNPAHISPGEHSENIQQAHDRGLIPSPEACPNGHPYTDENTYRGPSGWRECRACRSERNRGRSLRGEYRARRAIAAQARARTSASTRRPSGSASDGGR